MATSQAVPAGVPAGFTYNPATGLYVNAAGTMGYNPSAGGQPFSMAGYNTSGATGYTGAVNNVTAGSNAAAALASGLSTIGAPQPGSPMAGPAAPPPPAPGSTAPASPSPATPLPTNPDNPSTTAWNPPGAQTQAVILPRTGQAVNVGSTSGGAPPPAPTQTTGSQIAPGAIRSAGGGSATTGGTTAATPFPYSTTGAAQQALSSLPTYTPTAATGYPQLPGGQGYPTNNGYGTAPYTTPTGTTFDTGPAIAPELESNRSLALAGGQQLENQFGAQGATASDQAAYYQQMLAQAYAPLLAGQGGYTQDQQNAIMAQTGQFGLNQLDPNAYLTNLQGGAANLNAAVGGEQGAVNQALTQGDQAVNATINPSALAWNPSYTSGILGAYGGEVGNVNQALTTGTNAVNAAINPASLQWTPGMTQNVNTALTQGDQAVASTIDPNALQWTPAMTQAMQNQAAQASAAQTQATIQNIQNQAFAAGNVSPAAIAAMTNQAQQTGQISAANALTANQVAANQAQLSAAQQYANIASQNAQQTAARDVSTQFGLNQGQLTAAQTAAQIQAQNQQQLAALNTSAQLGLGSQGVATQQALAAGQLGAAQTYANLASQNAQENAQRDVGAQLQTGAQNVGAQQYLAGAGQSAVGSQQTELENANQLESGRATTVANANLQAGQEARNNYLGTQEQQATQTGLTTNQQQLGALSTQLGGANQASSLEVQNKAVNQSNPGTATNILGFARGGLLRGPRMALVGERGPGSPEAIVPLGPPKPPQAEHLIKQPRFSMSHSVPNYGIGSPSQLARTMTRTGFQRILPQFQSGGVVSDDSVAGPSATERALYMSAMNPTLRQYAQFGDGGIVAMQGGGTLDPDLAAANAGLTDEDTLDEANAGLTDTSTPGAWGSSGPTWYQRAAAVAAMMNPRMGALLRAIPGATYGNSQQPEWQRILAAANPRIAALSQAATAAKAMPNAPNNPGGSAQNQFWSSTGDPRAWTNPNPLTPYPFEVGNIPASQAYIAMPGPSGIRQQPGSTTSPNTRPINTGQTHNPPAQEPGRTITYGTIGPNPPAPPNMGTTIGGPVEGTGTSTGTGGGTPAGSVNETITYPGGPTQPLPPGTGPVNGGDGSGDNGGDTPPVGVSYGGGDSGGDQGTQPPVMGGGPGTGGVGDYPTPPGTGDSLPPPTADPNQPPPIYAGNPGYVPPDNPGGVGDYPLPPGTGDFGGGGGGGDSPAPEPIADIFSPGAGEEPISYGDDSGGFARGATVLPGSWGKVPTGSRAKRITSPIRKARIPHTSPASLGAQMDTGAPPPDLTSAGPGIAGQVGNIVPIPPSYARGGVVAKPHGSVLSFANGGMVSPDDPRLRSPYGPTEIVDGPQLKVLGDRQATAVVPLKQRKTNKVKINDVQPLIRRYGSR